MRQTLLTSRLGAWLILGSLAGLSLMAPVVGCTGRAEFDRDAIRATFRHDAATGAEQNVAVSATEKPTTPMPFRLALYFVQRDFPAHHAILYAEWSSADKDTLGKWLAPLQDERVLTETFLLVDSTIQGNDIRKIRRAAARYGADAVLIVEGAATVNRYNNGYAVFYFTLIGAYLVPGTVSEALFMIDGSLWDVRAERLYLAQTAEGHSKSAGSAVAVEDREVLAQAKKSALDEFGKRMVDDLRFLKDAPPRPSDRLR